MRFRTSALALLGLAAAAAASGPDGVFMAGRGEDPITIELAGGAVMPASERFACAACHGIDGRGGGEAAAPAPAITWPALSAATDRRPAYDSRHLHTALAAGTDPAGRRLSPIMPRYRLSARDEAALVESLVMLGDPPRYGVEPDRLRLGMALPPADRFPAGPALLRRLRTAIGEAGIFGRRPEVIAVTLSDDPDMLRRRLIDARLLALVSPIGAAGDLDRLETLAGETGIPLLFPIPAVDGGEDRARIRGHFAPMDAQAIALAEAASRLETGAVTIVAAAGDRRVARAAERAARRASPAAEVRIAASTQRVAGAAFVWLAPLAHPETLPDGPLLIPLDLAGPALKPLVESGRCVVVADPRPGDRRGRSDLERSVDMAGRLIRAALRRAGGNPSRATVVAAIDALPATDGADWPRLDYAREPLSGTRQVATVTFNCGR